MLMPHQLPTSIIEKSLLQYLQYYVRVRHVFMHTTQQTLLPKNLWETSSNVAYHVSLYIMAIFSFQYHLDMMHT